MTTVGQNSAAEGDGLAREYYFISKMARNISTVIRRKTDKEDLFLAFAFQINFHTGHKNLACFREDSKKNRQKTDLSTKNRTTTGVDG